jgi:hypothetical protein
MGSTPRSRTLGTSASKVPNVGYRADPLSATGLGCVKTRDIVFLHVIFSHVCAISCGFVLLSYAQAIVRLRSFEFSHSLGQDRHLGELLPTGAYREVPRALPANTGPPEPRVGRH